MNKKLSVNKKVMGTRYYSIKFSIYGDVIQKW